MKKTSIKIDKDSGSPIYRQIIAAVCSDIEDGVLTQGSMLRSVNEIADENGLSRDSVFKAYNELRAMGLIQSVPGKGYFITSTNIKKKEKIFFLLDEFSDYKKQLFENFGKSIGNSAAVDLFFHNYNIQVMDSLIKGAVGSYTKYVVWPVMTPKVKNILKQIPANKLYIVDAGVEWYFGEYPGVYQDYAADITTLFMKNIRLFRNYKKITLVFPERLLLYEIQRGFEQFLKDSGMRGTIVSDGTKIKAAKGEAYFVIDDEDLVHLVNEGQAKGLRLGHDFGVIAYNETPLKSIAAGGITVLSSDFGRMGTLLAELMKNKKKKSIRNPSDLFVRGSL